MKLLISNIILAILFLSCGEKSTVDTFSKYKWYTLDQSKSDNLGRLVFRGDSIYRLVLGTEDSLCPEPIYASDSVIKMYYPVISGEQANFHKYSVVNYKKQTFLFVSFFGSNVTHEKDLFIMKPAAEKPKNNHNLPIDLDSLKTYLDNIIYK